MEVRLEENRDEEVLLELRKKSFMRDSEPIQFCDFNYNKKNKKDFKNI